MVDPSDADGSLHGNSSSGCPVQHSSSAATTAIDNDDGQQQQPPPLSGRLWSGVASWLPFRGTSSTIAEISNSNEVTGNIATNSATGGGGSGGGGGGPARTAVATQENGQGGGCPANRCEDGGGASSGCPVQHSSSAPVSSSPGALGTVWGMLTGGGGEQGDESGVPSISPAPTQAAAAAAAAAVAAGQEMPLSTSRQRSSIPKAEFNPDHQPQKEAEKWVYPSEQQYYNAIKRKGYKASASDMPSTLAIHNAVNEKGWEKVREWERARAEADIGGGDGREEGGGSGVAGRFDGVVPDPKLLRFTGRPQDTSPKAWIKSNLLGYRPPFDRHDWVVKRADGTEARYVIDFYAGKPPPGSTMPVAMHLDVRPALDSVDAAVDRTRMFYRKEVRPYLSGVLDAFKNDPGPPPSDQDAPPPSAAR
ncbi:unnamed protein product [Pylaiella littoralis]